ncbi:hypothetical protein TEA_028905 [Camellia sinensis var. sinensis]|uniref:Uncharacterized protein n=1 Tax=Camellia sinensis var. sinensis TaxID=542762 RepID=A0A4S4DNE2_CAMSN|nr:hypothetical protein TEA_028905 [Camellia sinensis var. sinensis]
MEPFPSSAFKVVIRIFPTTTKIRTNGRSARARAQGFVAIAAPFYSSGPGACPDGRNSRPGSSYLEGNFEGNQLLDGSISFSPLYPSQTNDLHACSHSNPSQKIKVGRRCNLRGDPVNQLPCALQVYSPVDSYTCQIPWSVFQDGPNAELAGRHRKRADAEACPRARAANHDRGEGISSPRPKSIGGPAGRRSTSDRGASPAPIRFSPDNFKHSLTLLSKSFSSFARGSGHDGALTLSGAPFQGTWARSAAEDASPDYNSNDRVTRFSSWGLPGALAVTRGILGHDRPPETASTRARRRNDLSTTTRRDASSVAGDSPLGRPCMGARGGPTFARSPSSPLRGRGRGRRNVRCPGRRALNLMASGATCVQRLDGSQDSVIHTKYRISLRSSSMRELRYPLPRVVQFFREMPRASALSSFGFHGAIHARVCCFAGNGARLPRRGPGRTPDGQGSRREGADGLPPLLPQRGKIT